MSSTIHGLTETSIVAQPDLTIRRDKEGKTTGTRSFTILKTSKGTPYMENAFRRGAPITELSGDLGAAWSYLELEEPEFADQPGGFCFVYCTFSGYTETGDYDFDKEKTYILRGVLTERPIIEHPNYIAEVKDGTSGNEHAAITGVYNGTAFAVDRTATNPQILSVHDQSTIISSMTDTNALKWWQKIEIDGIKTYLAPQYEWTVEEANAGGLTDSDLEKFGRKEIPPGSPPEPNGVTGWWHFVDIGDTRSTNSSSNSRTWRFNEGTADSDIYDY
jgi:hypothetical protein